MEAGYGASHYTPVAEYGPGDKHVWIAGGMLWEQQRQMVDAQMIQGALAEDQVAQQSAAMPDTLRLLLLG